MAEGRPTRPIAKPRLLIVGGPDVDSRLDLMERLATDFVVSCAGSDVERAAVIEERGFRFHAYPMHGAVSPWSDLRSLSVLRRIYRQEKPHVIHAFATKPAVWGRLAAIVAGVPVVVGTLPGLGSLYSSHGRLTRFLRAVYEILQTFSCKRSSATVFQNESDRQQMIEAGVVQPERAYIIPGSGVRTDQFRRDSVAEDHVRSVREEMGAGPNDTVVTMVARLIRPKGVMDFADAARRLQRAWPESRFVLVGPAISQSVDSLEPGELTEVRQSVTWLGPRDDVSAILAASDVFVLPSYYREGLPRALLEAGSMGLPLVAADVPGSRAAVEDGITGFLVEPRDVQGLVEAIDRLLRDRELRAEMGAAARLRCEEEFDLDAIAKRHLDLYHRLLAEAAATQGMAELTGIQGTSVSDEAVLTERDRISK